MSSPTWRKAASKRLPAAFGEWGGMTLDEIASTDAGLCYLDSLRGRARATWLREALRIYLDDPTIAAELDQARRSI